MSKPADNFVDIRLTIDTIDIYGVRRSIHASLTNNIGRFKGVLLDVGCGRMPYKKLIMSSGRIDKYIGMDLESSAIHDTTVADLFWDGRRIPLEDNSVDTAMATEVFEHCFEVENVLNEIHRVLKPGGSLFFTVPFLWPLHEVPFDAFRYTPFSLERSLKHSGFKEIVLKPLGGWDASLAQMIGLWIRRRPLGDFTRRLLSLAASTMIKYLYRKDLPPITFREGSMITGLAGTAVK